MRLCQLVEVLLNLTGIEYVISDMRSMVGVSRTVMMTGGVWGVLQLLAMRRVSIIYWTIATVPIPLFVSLWIARAARLVKVPSVSLG